MQANAPSTLGSFDSVRKSCSCSCTLGGGTQALGEFAAPLESVRLSVLPLASFLALLPPPYLPLRPPHPPRASVLLVLVLVLVLVLLLLLLLLLVLFLLSSLPPPPLLPPPPPPPPPPPLFSSFSRSSTVDDFPFPSRRSRRAHANRPLASHMHARDSTLAFSPSGRFSIVRVSRLLLLSLSLSFFLNVLHVVVASRKRYDTIFGHRDVCLRDVGFLDGTTGQKCFAMLSILFLIRRCFPLFNKSKQVQKYIRSKKYTRGEFVASRGTRLGLTLHRCSIAICNVRGQLSRDRICLSTRLADGRSSDDKGSKVFAPENCHSRGKSFEERPRFVCFRATRKNGGLPVGKLLSLGIFTTVHLRS